MSFCTIFTFVLQKMCFLTFRCINGGKSNNNEDNSYACDMCIKAKPVSSEPAYRDIGYLKSMERTLEQEPPKLLVILQWSSLSYYDIMYYTLLLCLRPKKIKCYNVLLNIQTKMTARVAHEDTHVSLNDIW